ncbi:RRP12-like protein [Auxenochlorella protothecoides]|uniref:RRP12-like protein n=1 Tax=Auxenochlorella protothecoides TaxID=3075 RepID=A0A087SKK1_AUXPR|nr:RRP12-like protein [Auxenochlorella protothecoides]KFM26255.1 RRP12-like protein [Auxenochlorella protothecoides]
MELASLRSALDEAPAHPSSRPTAPSIRGDGAFIAELRAKHSHSSQPESRQLLAIASALLEVVREEGLDPTPTALFAAAMASLERPDVARSPPLLAGMATLLNSLLPRVPNPVLRAKFAPASALLRGLLAGAGTDAQLARPALGALCQVLAAADPADWPAALPSFGLVLAACADARPKVRRRAHAGLEEVLAAMGVRPATLAAASDLVAAEAERRGTGVAEVAAHLRAVLACELSVAERRDVEGVAARAQLLAVCTKRLHRLETMATPGTPSTAVQTWDLLPRVFQYLLPLLGAELDSVRGAAADTLGGLLEACGLRTGAQARTWMLPLLRQNGGAGELGFWAEQLLPTAQAIGKRGAVATKGKKDREAQLCATLESQLWACLPAFVSWAEDGGAVWRQLEKPLLEAFHRNEQYRNIVCNSFTTLCNDISRAYSAAGQQLGHANPVAAAATPSGHDQEGLLMDEEGADSAIPIPAHYTLAAAQAGLAELRAASAAWLPQLLDGFLAAPPAQRGTMQATLGALACAADPAAVARLFKTVAQQLLKEAAAAAATGAGTATEAAAAAPDPERRASLLELALALAGGLDARGVASLLMRSAAVSAGGRRARGGADDDGDDEDDFPRDGGGRMVVHDPEAGGAGRKRRRASEHFDSDDSDFEDLRGFSGLDLALKGAQSHTGERFKSAKAGGDVSKGRTEPYAYWPLDRRLMNRRAHKAKGAKQGLDAVVNAGRRGPKRTKTARD